MSLLLLILLVIKQNIAVSDAHDSNVCKGYLDYATIKTNKNCWYNPDVGSTTEIIIRNHGYDYERYNVTTSDGYILTVFRLISNHIQVTKGVVFLQHGIITDSIFWVTFGKRSSLAFQLADQGYDVWLGNARGTYYSKGHILESISQEEYWNFSFHEMGTYDLPAEISLVSNVTDAKGKIIFIGHSMGTTMSYVYALTPHADEHLKYIISLAPIAYWGHITSSVLILAPFGKLIQDILNAIHIYNLSLDNPAGHIMVADICSNFPMMEICLGMLWTVIGNDAKQLLAEDAPLLFQNVPNSAASVKNLMHYDQILNAHGRFQYYDYEKNNMNIYGTSIPPIYDIGNIKLPVFIFYGPNDAFVGEKDSMDLYNALTSTKKIYRVPLTGKDGFNHMDFAYAKDIDTLFYPLLYDVIKNN